MQKGKNRQVKPAIQTYLTEVHSVYVHPSTFLYVLIGQDGIIRMYDITTMSVVGCSIKKLSPLNENRFCVFTSNINKFYLISGDIKINQYELKPNSKISEKALMNEKYPFKIVGVQKFIQNQMINVLTNTNFVVISTLNLPPFKVCFNNTVPGEEILDGRNIKNNKWVIATNRRIMAVYLQVDRYNASIQVIAELTEKIHNKIKLYVDDKSGIVSFVNSSCLLTIFQLTQKFNFLMKIKLHENKKLNWMGYVHYGTSTSTVNKFQTTVTILANTEHHSDMIDEKKQIITETCAYIIELRESECKSFLVKGIKGIKSNPWHSEFLQNKLNFLTLNGELQSADLVTLVQGKNIGKEWVNLSYRFEALEQNQQYEQVQDQFEKVLEDKEIKQIKEQQLGDWSQCLFTKQEINRKRLTRLNCFQF